MTLQSKLQKLFLIDQTISGLTSRWDAAQARHRRHNARHGELTRQGEQLGASLKEAQAHAASLEGEVTGIDEKINEHRNHMNSVKTDKEYRAILVEVNNMKERRSKLEDEALEALGKVEAMQSEIADLDKLIAEAAKHVSLAETEIEEAKSEVGGRVESLKAEREEAAGDVPPEALNAYQALHEATDGEPMAVVHEQDRRRMEYTCGACYMTLPAERVNSLMSRPNELTLCSSCGVILYLNEDMKTSASGAKKANS